jgi:hypothetical protein
MSEILIPNSNQKITRRAFLTSVTGAALALAGCGNNLKNGERTAQRIATKEARQVLQKQGIAIQLRGVSNPELIDGNRFPVLSKWETVLLSSQNNSGVYMFVGLGDQMQFSDYKSNKAELLPFDRGSIITFGSVTTANRGNILSKGKQILQGTTTIVYQTNQGVSIGINFPNIPDKRSFNQLIKESDLIGLQFLIANADTGKGEAWTFLLPNTFS